MITSLLHIFSYALVGYLFGSIPFGLIFAKLGGYGDIRDIGSGNIGATNVLRTGNKMLALLTLICDSAKGAITVIIASFVVVLFPPPDIETFHSEKLLYIAGLSAVLGHIYPVWIGFKGGKGVATTLGTGLALSPLLGGVMCGVWLLVVIITRLSSLSALIAFLIAPFLAHFWLHEFYLSLFCGSTAVIVFWRHRENIVRLILNKEPKIGEKKKALDDDMGANA